MQTYTVQSGDTLYGISKQFGVSVDEIKRLNNLTSNTITKGQTLKIPSNVTTIDYIVKKGDSLYSIAKRYNTTVKDITRLNNLTSNSLTVGQLLIIAIDMALFSVKVIFKRNGKFSWQHVHDNPGLRKMGIHCVVDQDREAREANKAY